MALLAFQGFEDIHCSPVVAVFQHRGQGQVNGGAAVCLYLRESSDKL